jgi:hypothetical protein
MIKLTNLSVTEVLRMLRFNQLFQDIVDVSFNIKMFIFISCISMSWPPNWIVNTKQRSLKSKAIKLIFAKHSYLILPWHDNEEQELGEGRDGSISVD